LQGGEEKEANEERELP